MDPKHRRNWSFATAIVVAAMAVVVVALRGQRPQTPSALSGRSESGRFGWNAVGSPAASHFAPVAPTAQKPTAGRASSPARSLPPPTGASTGRDGVAGVVIGRYGRAGTGRQDASTRPAPPDRFAQPEAHADDALGGDEPTGGPMGRSLAANPSKEDPQGAVLGPGPQEEGPREEGLLFSVPLKDSTLAEDFSPPLVSHNVQPAESGDGMVFGPDSVLAFPDAGHVELAAGSIAFEITPNWDGTDEGDNSLVQLRTPDVWANRLQIFRNGRYLRFILTDNTGQEVEVGAPIDGWLRGAPHTVTATWGEALTTLYVDGTPVGQNTYAGELDIPPGTPLYVGSNLPGAGPSADATLRGFKVYDRPLTMDEVSVR